MKQMVVEEERSVMWGEVREYEEKMNFTHSLCLKGISLLFVFIIHMSLVLLGCVEGVNALWLRVGVAEKFDQCIKQLYIQTFLLQFQTRKATRYIPPLSLSLIHTRTYTNHSHY